MKKTVYAALVSVSTLFASPSFAGHMPSIEIKIEGRAANWVEPHLVLDENEDEDLPLFEDRGMYIYDDATPGSYTLRIVDKKTGYVILREPMTVKAKGHHLEGNFRQIDCSVHNGEIVCLNLL